MPAIEDNHPLVSVVIPTRNRPEMLRRAIRRIAAQTYPGPIETVIVFDQTLPDETLASEDAHRPVRVTTNDRKPGLAGARNSGATSAQGHYLAFCDDDDEFLPTKIAAQVAAFDAAPDAVLVTCGILIQYGRKTTMRLPDEDQLTFDGFLRDRMTEVHPSTFLTKREIFFDTIGLVDEDITGSYAEDYEWCLRAAKAGPIISVPEPLTRVWWHKKSFFSDRWAMISDALDYLVKKYPEFETQPTGLARVQGQRAFAEAAQGHRQRAMELSKETISLNRSEPRAYLAALVASTPLSAEAALKLAHLAGKGI